MTITKRIKSHKTPKGYGLTVWVKDPGIYAGLTLIVAKYFEGLEEIDEREQETHQYGD